MSVASASFVRSCLSKLNCACQLGEVTEQCPDEDADAPSLQLPPGMWAGALLQFQVCRRASAVPGLLSPFRCCYRGHSFHAVSAILRNLCRCTSPFRLNRSLTSPSLQLAILDHRRGLRLFLPQLPGLCGRARLNICARKRPQGADLAIAPKPPKMMQAFQAFLVMQAFGSIEAANPDSPINDPTVHVIIVTWPLVVMWCVTALSLVITAFVCGRFHRTQPTAQASPPTPPRVQDLNCLTCGEYGHGARTCPMRRVPPPPSEPESGEEEASPEAAPQPQPEEEAASPPTTGGTASSGTATGTAGPGPCRPGAAAGTPEP